MFHSEKISFRESRSMNRLVLDYLDKKEGLDSFYDFYPDKKGFNEILKKDLFTNLDRNLLVSVLNKQFLLTENGSLASRNNIEKLTNKNTFTVTTGHQLCLFTGPLYFIYKILSVIELTEELKKEFPEKEFVPVYWMASEDHDLEEINHFHLYGKKITWEKSPGGSVGRMTTEGLDKVLAELKQILEGHPNAEYLISLFQRSYIDHQILSDATRFLVNELFGEYGLIVADGDDKALKKYSASLFHTDIFGNKTNKAIDEQILELNKQGYKQQVSPREINCFYLGENCRERIIFENGIFSVLNTDLSFSELDLKKLIDESPEKISPNVSLRPLYQQHILPNIAYVGGPGELAYWLQYKKAFEDYKIVFPALVPRASFTIIDEVNQGKIEKLDLSLNSLFKEETEQINELLKKKNSYPDFNSEIEKMKTIYEQLRVKIKTIDQSLLGALSAEEQKSINSLENLLQKVLRSIKQKEETSVKQIQAIHSKLFPNEIPQERVLNFTQFSLGKGNSFINELKSFSNPLLMTHQLLLTCKSS